MRPPWDSGVENAVFEASILLSMGIRNWIFVFLGATIPWGKAPEARIPLCIWAKSYNPGGYLVVLIAEIGFRLMVAGRNERSMGIRGSKMAFLRPPYHGDSERNFRVFEATIPWGKGQDRTAGKQRERDRVRERERERYPSFQKRDAQALRFGSMNSISRRAGGI